MIKIHLGTNFLKRTAFFSSLFVLFITTKAIGQDAPISTVDNLATTATTASVAITTTGFNEIIGTNQQLLFDPAIATATNVTASIGGILNYNIQVVGGIGYITFGWYPTNPPQTEDDGTAFLIIEFEKESLGTTEITWREDFNDRNWQGYVDDVSTILNDEPVEDFYFDGSLTFGTGVAVNLNVLLEGFYDESKGEMRKAQWWNPFAEELQDKFAGTVSDQITVELHEANDYGIPAYVFEDIELNQNGTASFFIEEAISGDYYLTVRHRNHLETVSASPLDFDQDVVSFDFTTSASQAFGENMLEISTGVWAIYAGDIAGNGIINILDLNPVIDNIRNNERGYIIEDINGDGLLNILDANLIINNIRNNINSVTP